MCITFNILLVWDVEYHTALLEVRCHRNSCGFPKYARNLYQVNVRCLKHLRFKCLASIEGALDKKQRFTYELIHAYCPSQANLSFYIFNTISMYRAVIDLGHSFFHICIIRKISIIKSNKLDTLHILVCIEKETIVAFMYRIW